MNENNSEEYLKHIASVKKTIQEIEMEDFNDSYDTVDAIKNRMVADSNTTKQQTASFIRDIKAGLGEKIKREPQKIEYIKRPWYYKIKWFFKRLSNSI